MISYSSFFAISSDYCCKRKMFKGENRLGALIKILLKNKRYSDAEKASEDEVYREQLYKEYKL